MQFRSLIVIVQELWNSMDSEVSKRHRTFDMHITIPVLCEGSYGGFQRIFALYIHCVRSITGGIQGTMFWTL
eukprot:CCRYP_012769-RB/>CCRYP_012769-RB protein AED:0.23 eAED:1.00 QI:0/-1/0/1/-1/0/1/0/71